MGCLQNKKTVLGTMTLMFFWVIPCNDTSAQDADAAALGREIYEEFCGACHGYDGVPLLPGTPSFFEGERLEKTDAELIKSIREGKGDIMPAWQDILSEDECADILRYVRSMAAKTGQTAV